MKIEDFRQILHDYEDSPLSRELLTTSLRSTGASEILWGYAESHVPGLRAWLDRQDQIKLSVYLHNEANGDHYFDLKDLKWAFLSNAGLHGAMLKGANLSGADLMKVNFKFADLTNANLSFADLTRAFLNHAVLENANFEQANLYQAMMRFSDVNRANFQGADLREAYIGIPDVEMMATANWEGALFDEGTIFLSGIIPEEYGMIRKEE